MPKSQVWTDIDITAEGKSIGYYRVPYSSDRSGYGWIPIPVIAINNGDGPRVLLMAGNHGDEYEGQVMLIKLARELSVDDISGQLLVLPGINAPAVEAGRRVSPIDGGNLNRLFPGDPTGTPTAAIAHFLVSEIIPHVDLVFDFHSGGYSSQYLPTAHAVLSPEPELAQRTIEFMQVFGMPNSIAIEGIIGGNQRLLGACREAGVLHMSTELGGGGTVSLEILRIAEHGLRRLLHHIGVAPSPLTDVPFSSTQFYRRLPTKKFSYAMARGLFEPHVLIGDDVSAGDSAGAIHATDRPWLDPEPVVFESTGTVLGRRFPARTEIGDCLYKLGIRADANELIPRAS